MKTLCQHVCYKGKHYIVDPSQENIVDILLINHLDEAWAYTCHLKVELRCQTKLLQNFHIGILILLDERKVKENKGSFPIPCLWSLLIISILECKRTQNQQSNYTQVNLTKPKYLNLLSLSSYSTLSPMIFSPYVFFGSPLSSYTLSSLKLCKKQ